MNTYFDIKQKHIDFHVESDDGTFNENVNIPESLVEDISSIVDAFKSENSDYGDVAFNVVVVCSLICFIDSLNKGYDGAKLFNKFKEVIGDSNGN